MEFVRNSMNVAFQLQTGVIYIPPNSTLAHTLELGENFAMAADPQNDDGVEFEILMCVSPVHYVEKNIVSDWGEKFNAGDVVIEAKYYQKWGTDPSNYILWNKSRIALVHVEHVKHVKFPMLPLDHRVQSNQPVY